MAEILFYGEDGLTYLALTCQLGHVLESLGDRTPINNSLLCFRPSFGRSGGATRSEFGEFDAILATPQAVYLIESKWDGSPQIRNGYVVLAGRQYLRHQIFRWLRTQWGDDRQRTWAAFYPECSEQFANAFQRKPLGASGTTLACNLEYYLNRLAGYGRNTRDVLLLFHRQRQDLPRGVMVEGIANPVPDFQVVLCHYNPVNDGGICHLRYDADDPPFEML
jgi:hypothetical protein